MPAGAGDKGNDIDNRTKQYADCLSHVTVYGGMFLYLIAAMEWDRNAVVSFILGTSAVTSILFGLIRARKDKSKPVLEWLWDLLK